MTIQGNTQLWTFGSPFTIRFSITATGTPTPTMADFYIYNLDEKVRNDIALDAFGAPDNYNPLLRQITMIAGYNNFAGGQVSPPIIAPVFAGNVFWAYTYRQGPDWITQIHCADGLGAIDVADIHQGINGGPNGIQLGQIYRVLCQALKGLNRDISGYFVSLSFDSIVVSDPVNLVGNPWQILIDEVLPRNAHLFIQQGVIYVLLQNEYVSNPSGVQEINADSGLIGTPRRQQGLTIADMVFEPRLSVGQSVTLRSVTGLDGTKLMSLRHYGEISEAECGDCITQATFLRVPNLVLAEAA